MIVHLRTQDLIDPEMEAHYSFKTIRPLANSHGRISTTIHDHDFYELFLIRHGRIWHLINNNEVLLPTGSLVFIRPHDRHSFRQLEGEDCGLINLAFPTQTVTALFSYLGDGFQSSRLLEPKLPPTVLLHEAEQQTTIAQLSRLNGIPHTEKRYIRTQLRLLLADLLGRHFIEKPNVAAATAPNWLHELIIQMQSPANLRDGVSKMQALAHTSPEHLSRTVRKELGCTPTEYVNNLRLTYAANLLIHSDQPIVDISYEIGLDNVSYFYRIFKQRYDTTPAQFRTQHRKRSIP